MRAMQINFYLQGDILSCKNTIKLLTHNYPFVLNPDVLNEQQTQRNWPAKQKGAYFRNQNRTEEPEQQHVPISYLSWFTCHQ